MQADVAKDYLSVRLSDMSDHRLTFETLIFILGCIHNGELPPPGMCEIFASELSKRCCGTEITNAIDKLNSPDVEQLTELIPEAENVLADFAQMLFDETDAEMMTPPGLYLLPPPGLRCGNVCGEETFYTPDGFPMSIFVPEAGCPIHDGED